MLYSFEDKLFKERPTAKTAVVYMIISNYTNYGKRQGWFGSTRQMSEQAFVSDLSKSTVATCIAELLEQGLIEKRGKAYFTVQPQDKAVQLQPKSVQLRPASAQLQDKTVQLQDKTVQPQDNIIYNEDNKKDKNKDRENINSAHIDSCDTHTLSPSFDDLFLMTEVAFRLLPGVRNITDEAEAKAWKAWQNYTLEQQQAIYNAVKAGYSHPKGNFQFAIEDFLNYADNYAPQPKQSPTTQEKPVNYQGLQGVKVPDDAMPAIDPETNQWGYFSLADINKHNLVTRAKLQAQPQSQAG